MGKDMDEYREYIIIFNRDIQQCSRNEKICVTGIVTQKWKRPDGGFGLRIQDLTGLVTISFPSNNPKYKRDLFQKGKRIRVCAQVAFDANNIPYLRDVTDVEFLDEINEWSREYDIMEQESLVLISKICNKIRTKLSSLNFVEVNTRVISRYVGEEILEPLLAVYQGYGAPYPW